MVRAIELRCGALAQLGERLHGMQEVSGSIPLGSTKFPFSFANVRHLRPSPTRAILLGAAA